MAKPPGKTRPGSLLKVSFKKRMRSTIKKPPIGGLVIIRLFRKFDLGVFG
jgi:hypothetical protein